MVTVITMPLQTAEVSSFPLHCFQVQVTLFQRTATAKPEKMKCATAKTSQEDIKLNRLEPFLIEINKMIT